MAAEPVAKAAATRLGDQTRPTHYLTPRDIAAHLQVSTRKARQLMLEMEHVAISPRALRVSEADFRAWADRKKADAAMNRRIVEEVAEGLKQRRSHRRRTHHERATEPIARKVRIIPRMLPLLDDYPVLALVSGLIAPVPYTCSLIGISYPVFRLRL